MIADETNIYFLKLGIFPIAILLFLDYKLKWEYVTGIIQSGYLCWYKENVNDFEDAELW